VSAGIETPGVDGRRARRERGRASVVDAMFALLEEGSNVPTVEAVAERAGVSASSVFRYFDSLDDLQHRTIERYFERFAHLFVIPSIGRGDLVTRTVRLVDARLDLYDAIGPLGRLARARALDTPQLAQTLAETRATLARQVRHHFAAELTERTPARADDLVALIDSLTSFEAWDLMRTAHARSRQQIRRAWLAALPMLIG
jgi:AcrR family transcriptional regulator